MTGRSVDWTVQEAWAEYLRLADLPLAATDPRRMAALQRYRDALDELANRHRPSSPDPESHT